MDKKLTDDQIKLLALCNHYEYAALRAVIEVESNGNGFALHDKITIQFEPSWFKRSYADWKKADKNSSWINNGVGDQTEEWRAFNSAFRQNPVAAMKSTSIGLMQVMGFHYSLLGFKTVGEMWDFAKVNEANQLILGIRFIKSDSKMDKALKTGAWATFAYHYNGELYKKYKYDTKLLAAYKKFKS